MQRPIFRKVALDRLSSPEQLDQLLHITPPRWFSTLALRDLLNRIPHYQRFTKRFEPAQDGQRFKTPTVLQMESVECGAAALAMILAFHGRFVSLAELRIVCGVSRDGSKASNLLKAAHGYGLKAKGYRKEPEDLRSLPLPVIVFWNFNHFLVVEGFSDDRVYLNDPATGPRVVSAEEFDQAFTGVVLVFAPGPSFEPGGTPPSLGTAIRQRLRGSGGALVHVVLLGFALLLPGLALPLLIGLFVDNVLIAAQTNWVVPLLLGLTLTAVARASMTWLQELFLLRIEMKLALQHANQFFWHLLHLPIAFFMQRYDGEIEGRVALNGRVAQLLCSELATATVSGIVVIGYTLLMFYFDVVLTLLAIGIALLTIVLVRAIGRWQTDVNRRLLLDQGQLSGAAYAGLHSIETIKATGAESDFFVRWAGYQAKVVNTEQDLAATSHVAAVVPPLLAAINTAAVLVIGSLRVIDGHWTVGMLVTFQSLMVSMLQPFNRAATISGILHEVAGSINRLDDVLRYPRDPYVEASAANEVTIDDADRLTGQLELRNVTFGYSRMAAPLIENLSLTLKPGERVALVGGSGSGKSTVAKLVAGLYEPWSGDILFDGKSRRELPRTTLTNSLAFVDQDLCLFAATVRDNLTLWNDTTPQPMVVQATRDAAIHEEILARPGGYNSLLDEGGRDLSGGQRQRLEIARALVGNPSILVLDEATSALDPLTENIFMGNLGQRQCTCLIVAHRLSTIRDAHEIIVLEHGKVVQRGTHDELSRVQGLYAQLMAADA